MIANAIDDLFGLLFAKAGVQRKPEEMVRKFFGVGKRKRVLL